MKHGFIAINVQDNVLPYTPESLGVFDLISTLSVFMDPTFKSNIMEKAHTLVNEWNSKYSNDYTMNERGELSTYIPLAGFKQDQSVELPTTVLYAIISCYHFNVNNQTVKNPKLNVDDLYIQFKLSSPKFSIKRVVNSKYWFDRYGPMIDFLSFNQFIINAQVLSFFKQSLMKAKEFAVQHHKVPYPNIDFLQQSASNIKEPANGAKKAANKRESNNTDKKTKKTKKSMTSLDILDDFTFSHEQNLNQENNNEIKI